MRVTTALLAALVILAGSPRAAQGPAPASRPVPIVAPDQGLLKDEGSREPAAHGTVPTSADVMTAVQTHGFSVAALRAAGFAVVPWTVNKERSIRRLLRSGVSGIITDRPDTAMRVIRGFDANGDGKPGDLLGPDGLLDPSLFDVQGHRGARGLRPENTLPAMEAALDVLVPTLEMDATLEQGGIPVLSHDAYVSPSACRRQDEHGFRPILIRERSVQALQSIFVCDRMPAAFTQRNGFGLSPVAVAFAKDRELPDAYVLPTLQQVVDFVAFYADWYGSGKGASETEAGKRSANARRARFSVEAKGFGDPGAAERTAVAVAGVLAKNGLESRAALQSLDFGALAAIERRFPDLRTCYLFEEKP